MKLNCFYVIWEDAKLKACLFISTNVIYLSVVCQLQNIKNKQTRSQLMAEDSLLQYYNCQLSIDSIRFNNYLVNYMFCMHAHIHTHTHARMHTHTHTHTHKILYAHSNTHIVTYIHTLMHTHNMCSAHFLSFLSLCYNQHKDYCQCSEVRSKGPNAQIIKWFKRTDVNSITQNIYCANYQGNPLF